MLHHVGHQYPASGNPSGSTPDAARTFGVQDRIRCAKDTGLGRFPSRSFAIDNAWLSVVMLAADLVAWTQHLLLRGDLAKTEPEALRYRLLHVTARLARGQRRLWVRIQRSWPWTHELASVFTRLAALPVPAG